jgi:4-aminobutyrate aminotransferase-like enzyme
VLTAGESTVRLSPALTVSRGQVDTAVDILDTVLA